MNTPLPDARVASMRAALAFAAAAGFIAALPMVIGIAAPNSVITSLPQVFVVPFVLICPPWSLFWALMGQPDNTALAVRIGAMVLALNTLLYLPLGFVYARMRSRSPLRRWSAVTCAYLVLMAGGHVFFM